MEYIPVVVFVGAILFIVGCIVNFVANKLVEKPSRLVKLIVMVAFVAVLLTTMAYAEETKVIIVYYDDNTYLTEDGELHKEYGDLVPGDVIDNNKLISQSEHSFFEYYIEGEVVASFLYWEDAEVVYDHFHQELP